MNGNATGDNETCEDRDAPTTRADVVAWQDSETLSHFLIEKEYTYTTTADILDCSQATISKWASQIELGEPGEYDCPWDGCGRSFESVRALEIHYGTTETHEGKFPGFTLTCEQCGDMYTRILSQADESRFCSQRCTYDYASENWDGQNNPNWRSRCRLECGQCGEGFSVRPSRAKRRRFCSDDCRDDWLCAKTGENNNFWKGGEKRLVCEWCGDTYTEKQSRSERSRFCSKSCRYKWMRSDRAPHGPDHPMYSRIQSTCGSCGEIFSHKPSRPDRKYCSVECYHEDVAAETVVLVCGNCGCEYTERESRQERSYYCSQDCMGEAKGYNVRVELQCVVCESEYEVRPSESESVCCSKDCRYEYVGELLRGENNSRWKSVGVQCEECGNSITRQPYQMQAHEKQFCSQECQAAWRSRTGAYSGRGNPMWNGGGTIYNTVKTLIRNEYWPGTASRIRSRDSQTCRVCGKHASEQSRALTAHHIPALKDGGCNADELLMAVCDECHHKTEAYVRAVPEVGSHLRDWNDDELPDGRGRWSPSQSTPATEQTTVTEFVGGD